MTKGIPKNPEKKRKVDKEKGQRLSAEAKQSKEFRDDLEKARKLGRPPAYVSSELFAYKIAAYMAACQSKVNDKGETMPLTVAGVCSALGIWTSAYYDYLGGRYDAINAEYHRELDPGQFIEEHTRAIDKQLLEEYANNNSKLLQDNYNRLAGGHRALQANSESSCGKYALLFFSDITKNYAQILEQQAEERLFLKGRVADIFTMKARYKWQEEDSKTVTHRIEIATEEEARKALEELNLLG